MVSSNVLSNKFAEEWDVTIVYIASYAIRKLKTSDVTIWTEVYRCITGVTVARCDRGSADASQALPAADNAKIQSTLTPAATKPSLTGQHRITHDPDNKYPFSNLLVHTSQNCIPIVTPRRNDQSSVLRRQQRAFPQYDFVSSFTDTDRVFLWCGFVRDVSGGRFSHPSRACC
jgi:hypothetical protein